jgi:hypothetical protein
MRRSLGLGLVGGKFEYPLDAERGRVKARGLGRGTHGTLASNIACARYCA